MYLLHYYKHVNLPLIYFYGTVQVVKLLTGIMSRQDQDLLSFFAEWLPSPIKVAKQSFWPLYYTASKNWFT